MISITKAIFISNLYKIFVHILFIVLNSRFMTNTKFFLPFIFHDFKKEVFE